MPSRTNKLVTSVLGLFQKHFPTLNQSEKSMVVRSVEANDEALSFLDDFIEGFFDSLNTEIENSRRPAQGAFQPKRRPKLANLDSAVAAYTGGEKSTFLEDTGWNRIDKEFFRTSDIFITVGEEASIAIKYNPLSVERINNRIVGIFENNVLCNRMKAFFKENVGMPVLDATAAQQINLVYANCLMLAAQATAAGLAPMNIDAYAYGNLNGYEKVVMEMPLAKQWLRLSRALSVPIWDLLAYVLYGGVSELTYKWPAVLLNTDPTNFKMPVAVWLRNK